MIFTILLLISFLLSYYYIYRINQLEENIYTLEDRITELESHCGIKYEEDEETEE